MLPLQIKTVIYIILRLEALAEICDFGAGLVQRVPKKPSIVKADLQNSTARLRENILV